MEIVKINGIRKYNEFIRDLYHDDPYFKDNKSDITALICNPKSAFYANSEQQMIGVLRDEHIQCQAVLIHHKNLPDTLMIALFEAGKNVHREVDYLISYSKEMAAKLGCKRLTLALNGHCNYSIGFLKEGFQETPAFGQSYNPDYYPAYFTGDEFKPFGYTSYQDDFPKVREKVTRFAKHVSCQGVQFSHGSFSRVNFDKSMKMYTKMNNEIFLGHSYYFQREEREDHELFAAMSPLLNGDNLIFAMKNNHPVGFILWYHDYNQLVGNHGKAGINTFLKYKLMRQHPETVIVTEIGVYPEYENTGLILALLNELCQIVQKKYPGTKTVTSGWVQDKNEKSKKLVSAILSRKNKEFVSYEIYI